MKRKRGNKKGKSKGATVVAAKESISKKGSQIVEDLSSLDDRDNDSVMEVEVETTPSSTGTDQPQNVANINADGSIKKAGVKSLGRVKVKLKTSKILDPQITISEAPAQSDTDRSSQQMSLEKQRFFAEKMKDSANSLPENRTVISGPTSQKSGSIKFKSSKSVREGENQKKKHGIHLGKSDKLRQDSRYNKQELGSALTVIKKVMKMDAAEPFNVPVNAVALGIPDYFDVIDTPMDFGTICSNLESGVKYMNAEDVFKDVQYIWGNCYKYNNKGDYILDLMRRVKKNFSKYWTAAGLYNGPPKGISGADGIKENVVPVKGGQSKHKSWKRNGRRHKHDCLCAVCVLKRRRREREEIARIAKGQIGASKDDAQEFKQEGSSPVESPCGEDSSSNQEDMIDQEINDGMEEIELKGDVSNSQYITQEKHEEAEEEEAEEDGEEDGEDGEEEEDEEEENEMHAKKEANAKAPEESEKGQSSGDAQMLHMEESASVDRQKHSKELQQRSKKTKVLNSFTVENPMVTDLCRILFPDDPKSFWRGPHSLGQLQHINRPTAPPTSSIRAAIDTFFK